MRGFGREASGPTARRGERETSLNGKTHSAWGRGCFGFVGSHPIYGRGRPRGVRRLDPFRDEAEGSAWRRAAETVQSGAEHWFFR